MTGTTQRLRTGWSPPTRMRTPSSTIPPTNDINEALASGVGVTFHTVTVPEDSAHARVSLFDDFTDGSDDLDLYVFDPDGAFVGGSGSGTSAEQVDLRLPESGDYTVVVHGWETDGPDASYTLFSWSVPLTTGGSLEVNAAPVVATAGGSGTVDVTWSGLAPNTFYLGAVSHTGPEGLLALTLVNVDSASVDNSSAPRPVQPRPLRSLITR